MQNRARVPPEKLPTALANIARVVPMLKSAQAIRVWSGIEGYLPDMLPVMGWSHTTKNLLHAYGFCGHGFQLSPGVGYTPRPDETGTREALASLLDAHGVAHALLVQPSGYGFDNSAMLEAMGMG